MSDISAATRPDTERSVVYPSAAVPAVPAFVFTGAAGWTVDEAPGALVVLRSPPQSGSSLDAILRHERVATAVMLEDAAKVTWARIQRESPDAKLSFERVAGFGPHVAYLRGFSFGAPGGGTIAELHAVFLAPKVDGRKTADLFQLAMTGPAEALQQHGQEFVDMVASFRFV
jgi:hypothetical protein